MASDYLMSTLSNESFLVGKHTTSSWQEERRMGEDQRERGRRAHLRQDFIFKRKKGGGLLPHA